MLEFGGGVGLFFVQPTWINKKIKNTQIMLFVATMILFLEDIIQSGLSLFTYNIQFLKCNKISINV